MLNKIKRRLLPPSSGSFHHFERTSHEQIDRINRKLDQVVAINSSLANDLSTANQEITELNTRLQIIQRQLYLYSTALYGKLNHTKPLDNRIQLFHDLPEATGVMRRCQLVTAKLMDELDKIIQANHLEYWFGYGSLLGAYTRHGCIPWDDDIDICMTRDNFTKLLNILKESNTGYRITTAYDSSVYCLQYRFCSKDENLPSFIDIGVWDYVTKRTEEKELRLQQIRIELMDRLAQEMDDGNLPYWKLHKLFFKPGDGGIVSEQPLYPDRQNEAQATTESKYIEDIFNDYIKLAIDEGILLKDSRGAKSFAYSLDNLLMPGRQMIYDKGAISPTILLDYEGIKVQCPKDTVSFLDACYNSWPYIPNDESLLEQRHFNGAILNRPEVRQAIDNFLQN